MRSDWILSGLLSYPLIPFEIIFFFLFQISKFSNYHFRFICLSNTPNKLHLKYHMLLFPTVTSLTTNNYYKNSLLETEAIIVKPLSTTHTIFLKVSRQVNDFYQKYQLSGAEGTRSPPAMPHRLHNPKWLSRGPKIANGAWKGVFP